MDIKPPLASSDISKVKNESQLPQIPTAAHAVPPQDVPAATAAGPTPPPPSQPSSSTSNKSPHTSLAGADSAPVPTSIVPKPQPKRQRRPELSKLIARDLDWYRSNTTVSDPEQRSPARTSPTQVPTEPMVAHGETAPTHSGAVQPPPPVVQTPEQVLTEPSAMEVESTITNSDTAQESIPAESLPTQAPAELMKMDVEMTADTGIRQQSYSAELPTQVPTDSMAMDVDIPPQEHSSPDVPSTAGNEQALPEVASGAKEIVTFPLAASPPRDVDIHDTVAVNSDPLAPPLLPVDSLGTNTIVEATDMVSDEAEMKTEPVSLPFPPPPPPPPPPESESNYSGAGRETASPAVDTTVDVSASLRHESSREKSACSTGVSEAPPLSVPHSMPPLSSLSAPLDELPEDIFTVSPYTIPAPVFESLRPEALSADAQISESPKFEKMVVLRLIRGKAHLHIHDIEFALSETMASSVSRWVNRQSAPEYVVRSLHLCALKILTVTLCSFFFLKQVKYQTVYAFLWRAIIFLIYTPSLSWRRMMRTPLQRFLRRVRLVPGPSLNGYRYE